MSTQITLPSAGGGTPLEGDRYTYVYGNKSGNLNGDDLLTAIDDANEEDTILVGPGNYYLGGQQINLSSQRLKLKAWGTAPVVNNSGNSYGPVNLYAFNEEDYVSNKQITCNPAGNTADITFPSGYLETYTKDIIQLLDGSRVYLGMYADNVGNLFSIIKVNTNNTVTNILSYHYSQDTLCYYNNAGTEYLAFYVNSNVVRIANANTGATLFNIVTNSYVTLMSNNQRGGDPSVYIYGAFSIAGGVASQGLAKFNITTGVVNSAFSLAVGTAASSINRIEVLPDTNLILTGYFTTFNGVTTPSYIYAINANGTITGTSATRNTNFGSGAVYPVTAYFINNFIVVVGDPTVVLTFNGNNYISNIISLDSSGIFVNPSITYDYRFDFRVFPIYGSERLGVIIYDNPTYLFFGGTTPGNVLITSCDGLTDYNYFYNAAIPYAFTINTLKNIQNSDVLFLGYNVLIENDPPVLRYYGGYNFSEIDGFILNSILISGFIYSTNYINNCVINGIYFSNEALNGTVDVTINNCIIKQIKGLIKTVKNSFINEFLFQNPPGYHVAEMTILDSEIGDFFMQENTYVLGGFVFENCTVGYAMENLAACSPAFDIKNSNFKSLLSNQNSFSNNIEISIKNSRIGQGLNLKGAGSYISFAIFLQNVIFDSGPAFNCNFGYNEVYGSIQFVDVIASQGFAVIQCSQLNSNSSIIEYTNCIAPEYSFAVYYSASITGLDIKHNSCIALQDSFNVFYGLVSTNYGRVDYYNCRAAGQSFNNIDLFTNAPKLTKGVYKDCVVTDPADPTNLNFQTIPAGVKDYMMNCSMNGTNSVFLNPATNGGSGRIIDCVKLSPTGVVTKYNY